MRRAACLACSLLLLASCQPSRGQMGPAPADTADAVGMADAAPADLAALDLAAPPQELADYLIQDVCARADGELLAVDPYDGCPAGAARRDLRVGEPLPYHRHDQPDVNNPLGFQRHDSFPRPGEGSLRHVHPFDFPPFGEYNAADGYDVAEADGAWAAIVGTRDPTGLAQTFFGPGCALADGWILLPTAGFLSPDAVVASLRGVGWEKAGQPFPGTCPAGRDAAYTDWEVLSGFPFGGQGGAREKRIDALLSQHYGGRDPATADHIEKFYLTRLYGLTRWERWQNLKLHPGTPPKTAGCGGPTRAGDFVRVDCRDWSHVVPEPLPWPPEAWPTPYAAANRLVNGDFGTGTITGWARLGMSQDGKMTNWSLLKEGGGTYLATNCGGPCSPGQSIYQDVPLSGLSGRFRFGGKLQTEAGTGAAELVVFQRDDRAAIIERDALPLMVGPAAARVVSGEFTVRPGVTQLRFQFYLNAPNTFRLDDLWLAATGG
jgi:hypothetical protein